MKILVSIILAFLFVGCSDESKKDVVKKEVTSVVKTVKKSIDEAVPVVKKVAQEAKEEVVKSIPKVKEATKTVVVKTKQAIANVEKKVQEISPDKNGKILFTVCAGCHGSNAEKQALGKSKIIKGWSVAKITKALNGYKDGTYGGMMKGVMKSQASKLSDSDIKAVAEYISTL